MSHNAATHMLRRGRRQATVLLTAAAIGASCVLGGIAAAPARADDTAAASFTGIILGVGASESQRIVTWYSSADTAQEVQLAPTAALVDGEFPAEPASFDALGAANISSSGGFNRHATLEGLQENTQYTYRVGSEGNWSSSYSFKTQSFDGPFDFLFYGDPQIGSTNEVTDGAGWADTLDVSLAANPNAEILVSGGDQVEKANIESQWSQFLASDKLRQYPWAATIGNHDVGGKAYEQHLYTPNTDRSPDYYPSNSTTSQSGGDYWYIYKDVLFIDLNSNSYDNKLGGGDAAHVAYVTNVVKEHGAEAKHTVLVYHHAIYSPASHAQDSDNKVRRGDFPTVFSQLGVDLVLQGHDHSYSRSYEIKNGAKANPDEQPGESDIYTGPGGVIYVTANSASGSKYYDITSPKSSEASTGTGNGPDPLKPQDYWYNSVQNQEHARTYVKVSVEADQLVVQNIRSAATGSDSVGSIVDAVTIHKNHGNGQDIQVTVPEGAPGDFGWTIDGHNGLVDLGTATENGTYFEAQGQINPITVSDTRRSHAPWALSAAVGDFRDGTNTFSGKYLGWSPKLIKEGAGATAGKFVQSGYDWGDGLAVSRRLGSADQGHPSGEAGLGADLDLKIPSEVSKGSYRSTLTITALSE